MPPDNAATVAPGAAVEFPQDGPTASGGLPRFDASTFYLVEIGTYKITWQVSIDEPGQLVLSIEGVELPETTVGRATGTTQISGCTFITTTDTKRLLRVVNPSGNSTALTITPIAGGNQSVSATLAIERLT